MGDAIEASVARLSQSQINSFFSKNAPATQQDCDQEAERILCVPVDPTPVQSGSSYTVVARDGAYVVQFRSATSALDMDFIEYIERAYDGFTPHHEFIGVFGGLHVYKMGNVGGASLYFVRDELAKDDAILLRQTVSDFARFFASAWHKTPQSMQCPDRSTLHQEYSSKLTSLRQGLPECFGPTLDKLISKLPGLFSSSWPLVPNYPDLAENSIFVSAQTGRLAGICDWEYTPISPFGMSLGGLEVMLGTRSRTQGCIYYDSQQELRDLFWETLYEAMGNVSEEQKGLLEVARLVGLFLENGFMKSEDDETIVPANEGHPTLLYLEAVTLKLWASKSGDENENSDLISTISGIDPNAMTENSESFLGSTLLDVEASGAA